MPAAEHPIFDPKNMPFRRLGRSGLRVPVFSLGGWLTLSGSVKGDDIVKVAFENGINMFDTAEGYSDGQSEVEMGRVIKDLNLKRSDLIIATKIFWGPNSRSPNSSGLSRKHIIEGTRASLNRLQMNYVDVIFAHRFDTTVSMEEIVRAFNWVIDQGWAFYWATSQWSAQQIQEAWGVAERLGLQGPIADQCQHNMFHRERPEKEYAPLYSKYGLGTMTWSPLANGLLTGKYNKEIPAGSRLDVNNPSFADILGILQYLHNEEGIAKVEKVDKLMKLAEELQTSVAALALAWVAVINPNTSSVILGASKPEQIIENLQAIPLIPILRERKEVLEKIEDILSNKPGALLTYGRPALNA